MTRPPRMRPTFELPVPGDGSALLALLGERLREPGAQLVGQVRPPHAFVRLPDDRRSLLSPHLNLELRQGESGTVLIGRFSPHPNVWTGFMGLFFALAMCGLAGLIYGLAQMAVDGPLWPMWAAPAAAALIAFIYGAAFIGQGLSGEEMFVLRAFVECSVHDCQRPAP